MHGFGWMHDTLRQIEAMARQQGMTKVSRIYLARGKLSHYPQDELEFAFESLKENTLCEKASLEFETRPAVLQCPGCGWRTKWEQEQADPEVDGDAIRCTRCGELMELISGTELEVTAFEGD